MTHINQPTHDVACLTDQPLSSGPAPTQRQRQRPAAGRPVAAGSRQQQTGRRWILQFQTQQQWWTTNKHVCCSRVFPPCQHTGPVLCQLRLSRIRSRHQQRDVDVAATAVQWCCCSVGNEIAAASPCRPSSLARQRQLHRQRDQSGFASRRGIADQDQCSTR